MLPLRIWQIARLPALLTRVIVQAAVVAIVFLLLRCAALLRNKGGNALRKLAGGMSREPSGSCGSASIGGEDEKEGRAGEHVRSDTSKKKKEARKETGTVTHQRALEGKDRWTGKPRGDRGSCRQKRITALAEAKAELALEEQTRSADEGPRQQGQSSRKPWAQT